MCTGLSGWASAEKEMLASCSADFMAPNCSRTAGTCEAVGRQPALQVLSWMAGIERTFGQPS